jgi:hypothetical protein
MLPRTRFALAAALAASLAALTGCGGTTATVSGRVTFGGAPLPGGSVQFLTPGGAYVAEIGPDGSYLLSGIPSGPAKISVTCQDPHYADYMKQLASSGRDPKAKRPKGKPEDFNRIPARFSDPSTSGLAYEVEPGNQTHNLDLK